MKTYNEVLIGIKNSIEKYKTGIDYLKLYLTNPDAVSNEISKLGDESLTKSFEEIKRGLNGEFTRQQATSMGSRLLVASVVKSSDNIIASFEERDNHLKAIVKLIKDVYYSSTENMDLDMLAKRRDIYRRDERLVSFFESRAEDKLTSTILKEVGTGESFLNYITRIVNVIEEIKTTVHLSNLDDSITEYETRESIVRALEKNDVDTKDNVEVDSDTVKVVDVTDDILRTLALRFVQNTNVVSTKERIADAMDDIINNLPKAISSVSSSLKILDVLDTKFPTSLTSIKELLTGINSNIEDFSKSKISTEELEKVVNGNISRIINRYNAGVMFDANFLLNLSKFGRQIYNINNFYILADTATLYGTIPDIGK